MWRRVCTRAPLFNDYARFGGRTSKDFCIQDVTLSASGAIGDRQVFAIHRDLRTFARFGLSPAGCRGFLHPARGSRTFRSTDHVAGFVCLGKDIGRAKAFVRASRSASGQPMTCCRCKGRGWSWTDNLPHPGRDNDAVLSPFTTSADHAEVESPYGGGQAEALRCLAGPRRWSPSPGAGRVRITVAMTGHSNALYLPKYDVCHGRPASDKRQISTGQSVRKTSG